MLFYHMQLLRKILRRHFRLQSQAKQQAISTKFTLLTLAPSDLLKAVRSLDKVKKDANEFEEAEEEDVQCPRMLRDLLVTKELDEVLGSDAVSVFYDSTIYLRTSTDLLVETDDRTSNR